jgi:hypothetical protein
MPANQFLFINKDLKSKSLSNNRSESSLAYSKINKHVQRLSARQRLKHKHDGDRIPLRSARHSASTVVLLQGSSVSPESASSDEYVLVKSESDIGDTEDDFTLVSPQKRHPFLHDPRPTAGADPDVPPLFFTIDSLPTLAVKLSATDHQVLQYFRKVWLPSVDYIPPECQIAGFTPVWPGDGELSARILESAMQSNDGMSVHALIAAGSRRMQSLHGQGFDQAGLPEHHTLSAVQALRKRAEAPGSLNERIILDISYLILADLYSKTPSRTEIYWKISRDLIVRFGGLQNLQPFITQAALAYDYFLSVGTLTMPALDPLTDTALLGIAPESPKAQDRVSIHAQLAKLEPRLRMVAQLKHVYAMVLNHVQKLPSHVLVELKGSLQHHVPKLYAIMAGAFYQVAEPSPRGNAPDMVTADSLHIQTRNLILHAWLWYSALGCMGYTRTSMEEENPWQEVHQIYRQPPHTHQASSSWKQLDTIDQLVVNSGWQAKQRLTLWLDAMGYIVSTTFRDRIGFRDRLVRQARLMDVHSSEQMREHLVSHLPLQMIAPSWLQMLVDAISEDPEDG